MLSFVSKVQPSNTIVFLENKQTDRMFFMNETPPTAQNVEMEELKIKGYSVAIKPCQK